MRLVRESDLWRCRRAKEVSAIGIPEEIGFGDEWLTSLVFECWTYRNGVHLVTKVEQVRSCLPNRFTFRLSQQCEDGPDPAEFRPKRFAQGLHKMLHLRANRCICLQLPADVL